MHGAPQPSSYHRRMRGYQAVVLIGDAVVLLLTALFAGQGRELLDGWLRDSSSQYAELHSLAPVPFLTWLLCLVLVGAYERHIFGGGQEEFRRVWLASVIAFGAFCSLGFFIRTPLSRGYILISFGLGLVLLVLSRYVLRKLLHLGRRHGRLRARVVVVANPDAMVEVVGSLTRMRWSGLEVVAGCVPGWGSATDELPVPVVHDASDVSAVCAQVDADIVLVAGGHGSSLSLRRIGWQLEGTDIDLVVVPSLIDVAGPRMLMRQMGGMPLIHIEKPSAGQGGVAKRAFDIVVASFTLIALAIPMLVVAAVIKLQDGGPVLYRQQRVGRDDERFWMVKFRSMVVGADRQLDDLQELNHADEVLFKVKEDPRVTRAGRFIRRTSIDELPQLLNVLRGEMSIVGPRPPLPGEVEQYSTDVRRRLLVRPGLTGLWQVSGRSDLPFDEAVRMDLYYVDNWSIIGDVIIMLKTIRAVVSGKGAY